MELSPSNSVEIYHILDLTVTRWQHGHKMAKKNCEKDPEGEEVWKTFQIFGEWAKSAEIAS